MFVSAATSSAKRSLCCHKGPSSRVRDCAEIEVKAMRYPVRWACHQKLNEDGTLTLRQNLRAEV